MPYPLCFPFFRLLEKELEEEHRREVERQKERSAEKERLHQQQVAERDRAQREEILAANLSREEKERLLKEHERNMAKLKVCVSVMGHKYKTWTGIIM